MSVIFSQPVQYSVHSAAERVIGTDSKLVIAVCVI